MITTIIGFIIAISILVFVHELGHFLFAKWTGCRVDEFAVGFKPAIAQKEYRGTNYVLGSVPVGGYVKIWGENGSEEVQDDPNNPAAFYNRPRWAQALVLFGGILFNFILTWLLFSLLITRGLEVSQAQFPDKELQDISVSVVSVLDDYPAKESGLQMGDRILGYNNADQLRAHISNNGNQKLVFDIERISTDNRSETFEVTMETKDYQGRQIIGAGLDDIGTLQLPVHKALFAGAVMTKDFTVTIVDFLAGFFRDLFVGKADTSTVSGPVGIASFAGDSFRGGIDSFVWFIAVLSLNLAIFNLLPIPALDGGRLVFVAIESIIRRPIDPKWFMYINAGGFIFLIGLILVVTVFDISKLF